MKLLHAISLISLGCVCNGTLHESLVEQNLKQPIQLQARRLLATGEDNLFYNTGADPCINWITGGDAETGSTDDWNSYLSGEISFDADGPFGSSRSYKISNRTSVNSGPEQQIDVSCLEVGKQYKLTAKMKIKDENGDDVSCNKHAEWFDVEYCPLFTIRINSSGEVLKYNLRNDDSSEWLPSQWNPFNAVFTVDDRLSSATDAFIHIRGPAPGVNMYIDDISVEEYLGSDTRYNGWTSGPTSTDFEGEFVVTTEAESENATSAILYDSNIRYKFYRQPYDPEFQGVINGDAESGITDGWITMGAGGGSIVINNVGPEGATKSFMHLDRPNRNCGPGQKIVDKNFFQLYKKFQLKAKIKLINQHGFPYACNNNPTTSACDCACPELSFVYSSNGVEQYLSIPNSITAPWIAEEFNEYHAIFEVNEAFVNADESSFFFKGPRAGVSIIFDDVSIKEVYGMMSATVSPETLIPDSCASLVTSGDADTGNLTDWEIKDVVSGELILSSVAPDGKNKTYEHKGRNHVSSGPGQVIDTSCLVEGKQYVLTAQVKIVDETFGAYTCDKFASWKDPDFCPLFTIWVEEADGKSARFNLGNDYHKFRLWEENEFNPYHAIFTVGDRLAAANNAYLYLRGPRPDAAMYFTDVSIKEYVGTDTRYNFWTALAPASDDTEISHGLPEWDEINYPTVPEREGYLHYSGPYAETDVSTGMCTQLVKNGDAEPGIEDEWLTLGTGGGIITIHSEGPPDQTKSFKHVGRSTFNSGPGQVLDLPCLELGKIYEVKAKIKLYDQNGFPFRCSGNFLRDDLSCPLFTIYAKQPTGEYSFMSKWNDMKEGTWYSDYFNEFHAYFQVDMDLMGATEAFWYFRGPRADISIALDDVSIKLFEHQEDANANTIVKPTGCQELLYNGDASNGSTSGWISHDGYGYVTLDTDGPQGNDGPAFKNLARSHASNGPGQVVDISCLENGRKYKVTASYFLEDGRGDPFQCNTAANWNTGYFCPIFSIYVDQPWGHVRWNYRNQLTDTPTAGWNDFETEFTIDRGTEFPDKGYGYFRGPAKDIVLYFNNVTVTMVEDVPENPPLDIPARDPNFSCTKHCCEIVKNGGAEDGVTDWVTRPENDGSLTILEAGADGTSSSIRHVGRGKLNSGPGQFIQPECLVAGQFYEIQAKLMIFGEDNMPYSCNKDVDWNHPKFCPLFSIWYSTEETFWDNFWFDVPNEDASGWYTSQFNNYHAIFQVTDDLAEAIETSFVFRGLPKGAQIVIDEVSLTPYMHEPSYEPAEEEAAPEFEFFSSSTFLQVNPYRQQFCDIPVVNGDFETGTIEGWFVNHGGELGIVRCDNKGGQYCLKTTQRTNKYMGPKAILELDCLQAGKTFDVFAEIQLRDENWEPVGCDKLAGRHSLCPVFTLHYTTAEGEEKWLYSANHALPPWQKDKFNAFYGKFEVSQELAAATDAYFYFERAAPGVSIILDNVEINELVTEADVDYRVMTKSCSKFVLNGNAETAELRGWMPRLGGELVLRNEGADMTQHSIMHTGRRSFMMGPKHDLAVDCFTGGMRYTFQAKVKLIDDETGQPFLCDKKKMWIDDDACPLLTFQLTLPDGSKEWLYFNSETKEAWKADKWNFFRFNFVINERLANATEGYFYMERVKAGVSILIDEVSIDRDCSVLIPNQDAEENSLIPWIQHGLGEVSIVPGGAGGSPYAFASTGRKDAYAGPTHMLDVECLTIGSKYTINAKFKLVDALDGNKPFLCDEFAPYGTKNTCPYFTLALTIPGEDEPKYQTFKNYDFSDWVPDNFNHFQADIVIDEQIVSASQAKMILHGPRPGVSILFDDASLELKKQGDCENLVPNGHFETPDEIASWSVADNGNIKIIRGGAGGSSSALICSDRLATSDGPIIPINNMCMYEGVVYEFVVYFKLLDANNNLFRCDKTAPYGSPLACPIVGIEMHTGSEYLMLHPQNNEDDPWDLNGWNMFKTVFVVSYELANAESAHFKFKGPAPGVSILIDDVSTSLFQPEKVNCNQLIYNPNAENGFTSGWQTFGGGFMEVLDGGDESEKAFAHFGRGGPHSGPKQKIETLCLEIGQKYDLNARFKFFDYSGNPLGCDKSSSWGSPDFCVLFTFELEKNGVVTRRHIGNNYGAEWVANEFNSYKSVLEIDEEFAFADSIYFWIQGPSQEKVIVMDNISLRLQDS